MEDRGQSVAASGTMVKFCPIVLFPFPYIRLNKDARLFCDDIRHNHRSPPVSVCMVLSDKMVCRYCWSDCGGILDPGPYTAWSADVYCGIIYQ